MRQCISCFHREKDAYRISWTVEEGGKLLQGRVIEIVSLALTCPLATEYEYENYPITHLIVNPVVHELRANQ
jgi:hypothetical protein